MDDNFLYQQIAETIRLDILEGRLKPGDRLASVRQLCEKWNCTPGTIQRAYHELSEQGLLVSHAGRGTQVAGTLPEARVQAGGALRRANLVHRSTAFLLEALTSGYSLAEIQQAVDLAMDRWRTLDLFAQPAPGQKIQFYGSHDMVINSLAANFSELAPGEGMQVTFTGSLGGLIALAEGKADLAGCHLWDAASDTYNLPFVQRFLPGRAVSVVTLAHRRLGLITQPGNPSDLHKLKDLFRPGVRFVNRQTGSGTRVWLDEQLHALGLNGKKINGYPDERMTHSDVARTVAEGTADVGLGLETAALAYGLEFTFLARERYDLVLLAETAAQPALRRLLDWLSSEAGRSFVGQHPGYENQETGRVIFP